MIELRYTLVKNGMFFCVWYVFHSHGSLPDNYHHNATSVFKYVFFLFSDRGVFFSHGPDPTCNKMDHGLK